MWKKKLTDTAGRKVKYYNLLENNLAISPNI